ncbi:MarR family winged helix-turn-helix transcriptional regulator [Paenibacillus pasadenensis]|uniref:Transcriptional regulator, MarR family n=1 Tax=Paenibacillus pasadenensis TaxID=217090 RepID=A0A2N5N605_9BACL|nr:MULTISPECIES: MarR family transcriptional regulator [Paenibacillus]PLT45755.1 Transcriptional regulator, MarR family [Paenibacillus pasadenensis]QGG56192.1 MarR family transcriptional regulator [Paenibacillus sp. B01]
MITEDFARLWIKISKEWKNHLEEQLLPQLTEGQLNVLELLQKHQPMKPSELLQHLQTTPAAITTLLDRMEKGGLIERSRDSSDRRIVWVQMTSHGEHEVKRGVEIREEFLKGALDRISSHNQQLLVYLLGKVANAG